MKKYKHKRTGVIGTVKDDFHLHYERCSGNLCSVESIPMCFVDESNDWIELTEMQSKDFRIGNLVYAPNDFIMEVVGVFDDQILLNFKGNQGGVFEVKPNEIKPIPLMEDMLRKYCFESTEINDYRFNPNWYSFVLLKKYFILSVNIMGGIKIETDEESMITFSKHIYFHELQNIYFALTGEELTIKSK